MERHARIARDARPLFPVALDSSSEMKSEDVDDPVHQPQQAPPVPAVDEPGPPYDDDIVSHVEAMPGCHEPVYETVDDVTNA